MDLLECTQFTEMENQLEAMSRPMESSELFSSIISENGEDDNLFSRRQSTASVSSSVDDQGSLYSVVYSEEEMQHIASLFIRIYKQYFDGRKSRRFPEYYYSLLSDMYSHFLNNSYLDMTSMDLLIHLLCCIQVRLFHFIFNQHYSSFVVKDLFEYLVSDIRFPSTEHVNFSLLRKATTYTIDRLKDLEEEIPHLRGFIQRRLHFRI